MTDVGDIIAGRYRLTGRIGEGAMGVVWQAHDESLDRVVAVKRLVVDKTTGKAGARAMREARLSAKLRHPHAITVHDVVDHDGRPHLVMEFVPFSLAGRIAEHGSLPAGYVARIGSQMASALAAAHAAGIVHRDVTPGNILLTEDGTAKIADFGISRATGEATVTGGGFIAGTPAYLAPEVAGGQDAGYPADVFSLGATLYAALEGRPPFASELNPISLLMRVASGEVDPPRNTGPLADVLMDRMLRRTPAERPTMGHIQTALAAVADERPVPAAPPLPKPPADARPEGPRPATRMMAVPRSRRRYVIAGVAAAALLAAGVLIGTAIGGGAAAPTAVAGPARPAPPTPSVVVSTGCAAQYQVTSSWQGGYQVQVTVHNDHGATLSGWTVRWTLPSGHRVNDVWNGTLVQGGPDVAVSNADWNAVVKADASTTFGLITITQGAVPATPALTCQPA